MLNHCCFFVCFFVFKQHHGDRSLSLLSVLWIISNKEKAREWVFSRELICRSDNSSLKNFLRIFQPIWHPSVTAGLLTFKAHLVAWWMVFKYTLELQRNVWEKDKLKSTKLAVLLKIASILWWIAGMQKRLMLTILGSVLTPFMEGWIFVCPYCVIPKSKMHFSWKEEAYTWRVKIGMKTFRIK